MSLGNQEKYCDSCGEISPIDAASCSNCGASLAKVYSQLTTSEEKIMSAGGFNRIKRDEQPVTSKNLESSEVSNEQIHESIRKKDTQSYLFSHNEKMHPSSEQNEPKQKVSTGRIIGIKELAFFTLSDVHGFPGRIFLFFMFLFAIPISSTVLGNLTNEAAIIGAIIPAILIIGYLIETMRCIYCGMSRPARWGSIINILYGGIFGLTAFLIFIVVPFSIAYWLGMHGQSVVLKIVAGIFTLQGLVGILWTGLTQMRFVETGNWNALFDYRAIQKNFKRRWKEYIISFFISILLFPQGFLYAIITMFAMPFWAVGSRRNELPNPDINPARYFAISIIKRIISANFFSSLFRRKKSSIALILLFYCTFGIGMFIVIFGFEYWYMIICTACFAHVYMGNKIRLKGFDAALAVERNYYQQTAKNLSSLVLTKTGRPALLFGIIILLIASVFGVYIISQKSGPAGRTGRRASQNQIARTKPGTKGKAVPTKLSSAEFKYTQPAQKNDSGVSVAEIPATPKRLWPFASKRQIKINDLKHLSAYQLDLMRNEIYAAHGWHFKRADLQNYFEGQSWYNPRDISIGRDRANKDALRSMSKLEIRNAQFIKEYEQGKGHRKQ